MHWLKEKASVMINVFLNRKRRFCNGVASLLSGTRTGISGKNREQKVRNEDVTALLLAIATLPYCLRFPTQ